MGLMLARVFAALLAAAVVAAGVQTWRLQNLQYNVSAERASWVQSELTRVIKTTELHDAINTAAATRTATTRRDLAGAVVAGNGLRDRAAAARSVGAAAAGVCPDAAAAVDLLADLPVRMDNACREIAEYADNLAVALDACQRAYGGQ